MAKVRFFQLHFRLKMQKTSDFCRWKCKIVPEGGIGNERETFFVSQFSVLHDVSHPPKGDCGMTQLSTVTVFSRATPP